MARWYALPVALAWLSLAAPAQSGDWTWVGGSNLGGEHGVYGKLGVPGISNMPGCRENAVSSIDRQGHIWLFGGEGCAAPGSGGSLNDLWEFNPSTREWTWRSGSSSITCPAEPCGHSGIYGKVGHPAPKNVPGGRLGAASWVDDEGDFWLFGGMGFDAQGKNRNLNDLWKFNPSANEWTWVTGSSTAEFTFGNPGVYGDLGKPSATNTPGSRYFPNSWIDRNGRLWMFGGFGTDADNNQAPLNDLWMFNPSTHEWTWMAGSSTVASDGVSGRSGRYGTLGVPSAKNTPGGRYFASSFADREGHFWLFGGSSGGVADLNDVWEFDPSTNQWAWMGGSNVPGRPGVYGKMGAPAPGNTPGAREAPAIWSDNSGDLWLFGGSGVFGSGAGDLAYFNDLWELNPFTNEWTWIGGSNTVSGVDQAQSGVYGELGVPDAENLPGARYSAAGWIDDNGSFWLFGGLGADSRSTFLGDLNDLWLYEPVSDSLPTVEKPAFGVPAGAYKSPLIVSISDSSKGATTYYRLNDGGSMQYGTALKISKTTTVRAIGVASGYANSPVATVTYVILKPQTVSWPKITGDHFVASKLTLKATASSGLAVTFASETPKVCTVSKTTVSLLAAGACTIRASQPGNAVYAPAPPLTQSIPVQSQ